MIYKLKITDPDLVHTEWWGKVDGLKAWSEIEFDRGLNILWAPSGFGKSTILHTLARYFHCEQGGVMKPTQTSMDKMMHRPKRERGKEYVFEECRNGATVEHDAMPVVFMDAEGQLGLDSGAFDDDFMGDFFTYGMAARRASGGQNTVIRYARMKDILSQMKNPIEEWKKLIADLRESVKRVNDVWAARYKAVLEHWKPSKRRPKVPRMTLLMDEPDRSLDFHMQKIVWERIRESAKYHQVIVASHSPFAIGAAKDAKLFDLQPGYFDLAQTSVAALAVELTADLAPES